MSFLETLPESLQSLYSHFVQMADSGDPGHDQLHIQRVVKNCLVIARETEARLEILIPAALLHDVVNLPKDHPERVSASEYAAEKARSLLSDFGLPADDIRSIAQVIIEHSYSKGLKPSSLESAILQDADRLDALGIVGLFRLVACGTRLGSAFYEESDPFAQNRELDDRNYILDHYYQKLLKLADLMNTETGQKLAKLRLDSMKRCIKDLESELNHQIT